MQCTNCQAELEIGEVFCGNCGTPATVRQATPLPTSPPPAPPPSGSPALSGPPVQRGTYSAEISRRNPACLLFLVDQSGSMEDEITGGAGGKKKNVVADAINRLLYNLVLRCTKESGVYSYFDIGVWSYSGSESVQPAFGTGLVSIAEISNRTRRMETRRKKVPDGAGGVYEEEMPFPIWFDAAATGLTPMRGAFNTAMAALQNWLGQHPASFPPIVINLTDGAYTDGDPKSVAWQLMNLGTNDGSVLIFNCHISGEAGASVQFPNDPQAATLNGLARELYEISSPMPEKMLRYATEKGYQVGAGARGYVFNADLVTMVDFLEIGSRADLSDRSERG